MNKYHTRNSRTYVLFLEGDSKSKTSFSAVCLFSTVGLFLSLRAPPQKYISHKNNKTTGYELCLTVLTNKQQPFLHGNFPPVLKQITVRCCCKSTVGKYYISVFGDKSAKKVFLKSFRLRKHKNVEEEDVWCRFHKYLSIVLLARWYYA